MELLSVLALKHLKKKYNSPLCFKNVRYLNFFVVGRKQFSVEMEIAIPLVL